MGFTTDLPMSNSYNGLWRVIDRFTKMVHFIPLSSEAKTAEDLARIFAREMWRLHGLLRDIISDRDSRFTSATWQVFLVTLGIKPRMSTSFHPQKMGKPNESIKTIKACLRPFINQEQNGWVDLLPMAEHAYNSSTTATGTTPFYANYGRHPESLFPRRTDVLPPISHAWILGAIEGARKALDAARRWMTQRRHKEGRGPRL